MNVDPLGYAFVPLSTETFGRLGNSTMALLNKLAEYASASGVAFKDSFAVKALRSLSVGLCRGNCLLNKRSLYALARASSNAFLAGANILTYDQGCFLTLTIDYLSASPWCCSFKFCML